MSKNARGFFNVKFVMIVNFVLMPTLQNYEQQIWILNYHDFNLI